ncbi:MAG: hypothetical protein HYV26_14200 [Candidatus Hydrogenedentes bacterium]|nr:hypothetical protein [Candidatus Hydrogenedentota bacterium]
MAEQLDDTTQARINELVNELIGTRRSNEAMRKEIRGHVEDKVLAYIHGEERLTQADALLLAREHFGSSESIAALLSTVDAEAATVFPVRHLLSFVITVFLTGGVVAVLTLPLVILPAWGNMTTALIGAGVLWLVYRLLARWRRLTISGEMLWFQRWPLPLLVCLFTLLLMGHFLTETATVSVSAHIAQSLQIIQPSSVMYWTLFFLTLIVALGTLVASAVLALWWCNVHSGDRRLRRRVLGFYFLACWLEILPNTIFIKNFLQRGGELPQIYIGDGWGIFLNTSLVNLILSNGFQLLIFVLCGMAAHVLYRRLHTWDPRLPQISGI